MTTPGGAGLATLNINTGTTTFSAGSSANDASLVLAGGTLVAGSDTAFGTQTLTINGGKLEASGTRSLVNNISVGGNFTINGTAADNLTLGGAIDLGGATRTITLSSTGSTTLAGVVSNGNLTKNGTGSLTLSGANNYADTRINAGTLIAANDLAFGTGTLTLTNTATLQASGTRTLSNDVIVTGNFSIGGGATDNLTLGGAISLGGGTRTITVDSTGSTIFSGIISGSGDITKAGAGTLTLTGANTYNNTRINAGTLIAGDDSAFGAGTLTIDGGTLQASGTRSLSNDVRITDNFTITGGATDNLTLGGAINLGGGTRTITLDSTGSTIFSGIISGSGDITKAGAGTLILSGANTYTGDTTVNVGILQASGGNDRLGSSGTTTINVGGTVDLSGNNQTFKTLNGAGDLINAGDLTIRQGNFSGSISGTGSLTKSLSGTLTLSGTNTYTGGTSLSTGTVVAGSDSALGTGSLSISDGTTLQASGNRNLGNNINVTGNFSFAGGATDNLTLSGAIDLGDATRTITVDSTGSTTLAGVVSNGNLTKNGTGSLTLSGANNYADTRINAGTLIAANDLAFGTGTLTLTNTATLQASGTRTLSNDVNVSGNFSIDGGATDNLTLGGAVSLGGATRTITVNSTGSTTLAGVISGSGSLTKAGAGSLTLSGANIYKNTRLTAGTLIAGDDSAFGIGTLTINDGTVEARGTRTVSNAVTMGGSFALGGGVTDNLTLTSNIVTAAGNIITNNGSGSNTLSGIISGAGGVTQAGAGSLTLSGINTYTGTTTVTGGTLNLTGDITGGGAFTVIGGTFDIAGTGSLTGNPTNSGMMVLNGNVTGNVTNNVGATLEGTGTITGTLTNNGSLNPGNSPGTLNVVGGPFINAPGSTLTVEVASPSSYDKVNVTGAPGTAIITGSTLAPRLLGGYIPTINQVFPGVITAAGGVTGAFSTVANQFITPILFWQPLYTATTFDLLVKSNFNNSGLNLTHNQSAVGTMLNGVANTASGDLGNVLNTIASLPSSDQVADAYKQISLDKAGALSTLAFAGANLQKRTLSRRITDLRFGNREIGAAGCLPDSLNFNYSREAGLMLAYNSSSLAGMLTSERKGGPAAPESRWGVYLDPAMILGSQRSSVDQTGFNFTIAGFNAGADYWVRDDLLVGLATGYSHTGARFQGSGGSVRGNTWPLTAYAAYLPQSFYAYGSLGYALNLFNLERQLSFGDLNRTAKSSSTGNQFNAYGEVGYDLKAKRLVVTPVLSLAYSRLWVDGFMEDGAGALNLKVSPQNATSLQTGVGGKVAVPLKRGPVTVAPQVYATYQHEYSNSSRGLDARLSQAGNTFVFQTDSPHRNFAVVGATVNILTQKHLKVQLDYNAEVGRGNYTAHYASAGVRWEF